MSDSYTVLPVNAEVREWLRTEGKASDALPDGRGVTLKELKAAIASLPEIRVSWNSHASSPDGLLSHTSGASTTVIVGSTGSETEPCEFHFRGGAVQLIVSAVGAIAALAGPQVVFAHSGSVLEVVS